MKRGKKEVKMSIKKIKMVNKVFICFFILLWSFGSALDNQEIIVDKISSYFTKIFSIQFEGNMEMNLTPSGKSLPSISITSQNLKYKFMSKGNKYKTEVSFFDPFIKKDINKVICWDGEKYQILEIGERKVLSISKNPPEISPYFIPNPLLFPFAFLLKKGDNFSLNFFQNQTLIKERLKNIEKFEEGQRGKYKGVYITFTKQELMDDKNVKFFKTFFAEELNYYPVFSQCFTGEDIKEEMEVQEILKIDDIIVPAIISISVYKKDILFQTLKITLDKNSMRVNIPIEKEIFNISFSQVDKVFDADSKIWIK